MFLSAAVVASSTESLPNTSTVVVRMARRSIALTAVLGLTRPPRLIGCVRNWNKKDRKHNGDSINLKPRERTPNTNADV
jgi:hypothetical protein